MNFFEITRIICLVLFSATLICALITLVLQKKQRKKFARISERMALVCAIVATVPACVMIYQEGSIYFGGNVFARAAFTNRALTYPGFLAAMCAPTLLWLPQVRRYAITVIPFLSVWMVYNWPF